MCEDICLVYHGRLDRLLIVVNVYKKKKRKKNRCTVLELCRRWDNNNQATKTCSFSSVRAADFMDGYFSSLT